MTYCLAGSTAFWREGREILGAREQRPEEAVERHPSYSSVDFSQATGNFPHHFQNQLGWAPLSSDSAF